MARLLTLLLSLTVFSLAGCGGGGGGGGSSASGDRPITNNFSAKSLQVDTPDPRIAYPLKVTVSMTAENDATDVSVSLFAIDKTDDPNAEVRQIPLGTQSIAQVYAGTHLYDLQVNVPSSVENPGSYYIAAIIDPVDEVGETDEDDNSTEVAATLSGAGPNILIADMKLDRSALLVNTDSYAKQVPAGLANNVHNADAGGTITVGAEGLGANETIAIEAFAKLRMMRSDTGTSYDVPLYLWNSDAGRYTNAFGIDPSTGNSTPEEWLPLGQFKPQLAVQSGEDVSLDDVDHNSAHINFYEPGKLGEELVRAMRYQHYLASTYSTDPIAPPPDLTPQSISALRSFMTGLPYGAFGDEGPAMAVMSFAVCVEIRPTNKSIVDRSADDNESCSPLAITLPPVATAPPPSGSGVTHKLPNPAEPWSTGDAYGTKGGGAVFAFGPIDFGETTTGDNRGYIAQIRGGIPMKIFSKPFDFMSVTLRAQLVPDYKDKPAGEDSGFTYELRFLNNIMDSKHIGPTSSPEISVTYSVEAPAEKEQDKEDKNDQDEEKQLFVGPVPVVASASVAGNIGLFYQFEFTETPLAMTNKAGPLANVEASMSAGVGTKFFSVGVEGVLTLLDERLEFETGTHINVGWLGYPSYDATDPIEFVIYKGDTLTNKFTGPQGALNLYAKYSVPKIGTCKWKFIKVKCIKVKSIKATKNIWRSPALFKFDDVLYSDVDKSLEVVMSDVQDPQYFGP